MTPVDVVQSQLDAYNARDIAAFARCYSPTICVRELVSGVVRFDGHESFRAGYASQFASWPLQRARVVQRQVAGDIVADTEFVTGVPDRADAHVLAIYHVSQGLIQQVWFSPRY